MLQGLIFTLEKFPLYSRGGELNQLVVGRQWQRGLPAATCFLSLLPCHPGGCERSPSWAENPLRLVSTRTTPATLSTVMQKVLAFVPLSTHGTIS